MAIGVSNLCNQMKESPTLAISEKAAQLKKAGHNVIGFGVGEPDFATPEFIREASKFAVDNGYTKYTSVAGLLELKLAIINKLKKENGLEYNPKQIIVSSGAKHSIYNCLRAILNEGDEVILPAPCWASYADMIELCGGKVIVVQGDSKNNFLPAFENIQQAVSPQTKAILINSPSNPCGNIWPKELIVQVAHLAVKEQFYMISDEIYEKLIYDGNIHYSAASVSKEAQDITILINGVSKAFSMTGYRIGYAAGPVNVISAMIKFQSQTTTNATSMAQYAAKVALESDASCCNAMRDAFQARRDTLVKKINAIPNLSCLTPEGAFYIMLDIRECIGKTYKGKIIENDMDFAAALLEDSMVAVVPGEPFFAPGFCRLSYALDEKKGLEGITRIENFVAKLQ